MARTPTKFVSLARYGLPDISMPVIRRYARQVAERFKPDKIILFGSFAYGEPNEHSDVDLLVVMPCPNEVTQAVRIVTALVSPPEHDGICYHCQQAAEKYLKALLQEVGEPIPRTHDLPKLLDLITPNQPDLRGLRRGLRFLKNFAVDVRYPGFSTTARQSGSALRWASRIRSRVRTILGLET